MNYKVNMEKRDIEEILAELIDVLEDPQESNISKELEASTFGSLQGNDSITQYLRETMSSDIKRYFSVSSDKERDQIKGAFSRTSYLLGKIVTHNTKEKKKENLHKV